MNSIESPQFANYLGVANNPGMFRDLLGGIPAAQHLLVELKDPANARKLLARTESLVREQDDVRYRNQRDAALAVYVWALNQTDKSLGRLAASVLLDSPRLWWARKTALQVLAGGFEAPHEEREARSLAVDRWNTISLGESSDALAVTTPRMDLIRDERVLNPTELGVNSQAVSGTSTSDVGGGDYQVTTDNPSPMSTDEL